MVKLARFFGYLLFFLGATLFFLPKVQLYYFAEEKLQDFKLVVDKESVNSLPFGIKIEDAHIVVEGIEGADVRSIELESFLVYTKIQADDIVLSSAAKSFVPLKVESIHASHAFWNPLEVIVDAKGEFGTLNAQLDLLKKEVHVRLQPSKKMSQSFQHTLRYLKKDQNGEYSYEKAL